MSKDDQETDLLQKIKDHIHFEEGMDDSMLSFYSESAKRYVKKKTGTEQEYLVLMVASVMNDHRTSTEDLKKALEALEPIFALEVLTNDTDEQS